MEGEEVQTWPQGGAVEGQAEDVYGQELPQDDQEEREESNVLKGWEEGES